MGRAVTRLTERALEKNPQLDPASVEAGVKAALEAAKDLLHEHEGKWYMSEDSARLSRWLAVRGVTNDFYELDREVQT